MSSGDAWIMLLNTDKERNLDDCHIAIKGQHQPAGERKPVIVVIKTHINAPNKSRDRSDLSQRHDTAHGANATASSQRDAPQPRFLPTTQNHHATAPLFSFCLCALACIVSYASLLIRLSSKGGEARRWSRPGFIFSSSGRVAVGCGIGGDQRRW
ncbi:hypothetical protein IWZ03DRAFT_123419 [Phyllosticta citriasiana]|uniref:Uncharacterized protein n=1 Tax=Phyllosticta citriasiana TaxID=595635 RepID=A0ABR1KCZ7_9PEZI